MTSPIRLISINNEPRVDSREIANHLGTDHRSTYRLIKRYAKKFERFGHLRFEITVGYRGQGGGKAQGFVRLNEDQCYFLLSLSRNTERVVDLKAELVSAFGEARRRGSARRLSLIEQLAELDATDSASKVKGQFGSKLMSERKKDLKSIRPIRSALESQLQPELALMAA